MAPIAKEQDTLSAALAGAGVAPPAAVKPQPAAVEIPVTVNGARTVEGSDKREPFSENTQTVLVFANGAVIRLASAVASGQLLFLTNDKTKKEVVCQVVKSKNYSRENGYVELEFTEAAPGFWGMRFSAAGAAAATPVAAKLALPVSTLPEKSLQEKLAEEKAKTQSAPASEPAKPAKLESVTIPEFAKEPDVNPIAPTLKSLQEKVIEATTKKQTSLATAPLKAAELATIPAMESADRGSKIPTLSEFLTVGAKVPELTAQENEKPATPKTNTEVSAKPLPEASAAQQAQLSSLIFQQNSKTPVVEKQSSVATDSNAGLLTKMLVPEKKEAQSGASAPLPVKANPAPGTSTFDFEAEEVKIPAWLEPLARNSPASAAVFETRTPELKANESKFGETSAGSSDSHGEDELGLSAEENSTEYSEKHEAVLTLSSEGPTPNFGSSLALDSRAAQNQSAAGGSRKGLGLGLLAAGLLLAAAGGWYWYSNQPQNVSAGRSVPAQQNVAAVTAPIESAPDSRAAASSSVNFAANAAGNRNPVNSTPVGGDSNGNASSVLPLLESSAPAPEPTAKPTLGRVHLAAPVVNHKASSANNVAAELAPALNDTGVNGGDPASLGLLTSKGKQPAAPLPVGGDVKQARLISSVAPAYPQIARNQRLSGDVVIDALVDVHGNVATMRVVSGPAMLHQAAMDALRQWKYQPATLNGEPMAMHLSVTVQFRLQ